MKGLGSMSERREEFIELLKLPMNMTRAIYRGLGRLIMDTWEKNVFLDNPYTNMTPEERQAIEESDRG